MWRGLSSGGRRLVIRTLSRKIHRASLDIDSRSRRLKVDAHYLCPGATYLHIKTRHSYGLSCSVVQPNPDTIAIHPNTPT